MSQSGRKHVLVAAVGAVCVRYGGVAADGGHCGGPAVQQRSERDRARTRDRGPARAGDRQSRLHGHAAAVSGQRCRRHGREPE